MNIGEVMSGYGSTFDIDVGDVAGVRVVAGSGRSLKVAMQGE